ncbi:unnamed protein product [Phaedon cochleariae]|uniref:Double jelly roll-like domain-containing protein n=1 Tax=Phaedon cochleariae TaxID=80249 RepID=A0A9N9X3K9_PHACE|nr:unnamed protein product [Phaedon cochleariae]
MGGEQVCMVRKPGITTTMKSMISYGESNMKFLETIGWGLDGGKQVLLDKASNVFSGKLPLKYLMGFAEDYCRGILNIKQELILIIARSFKNSYIGEVDADVEINKIEWKIRHVMPSDKQKLKLLTRLNRSSTAKVKIAYRMWDLYELPTIRETASDIWAVKTTNSLERPRYIIIGFQNTDNTDNRSEDITQFTHAGVSNIRLYLNSEVYPYERWNLDFDKKLDAVAYYAYDNFQRSYYGKDMSEPMMSIEEFRKNPLFIIDCNHQPDAMKSSTVDIKRNDANLLYLINLPPASYDTHDNIARTMYEITVILEMRPARDCDIPKNSVVTTKATPQEQTQSTLKPRQQQAPTASTPTTPGVLAGLNARLEQFDKKLDNLQKSIETTENKYKHEIAVLHDKVNELEKKARDYPILADLSGQKVVGLFLVSSKIIMKTSKCEKHNKNPDKYSFADGWRFVVLKQGYSRCFLTSYSRPSGRIVLDLCPGRAYIVLLSCLSTAHIMAAVQFRRRVVRF